MKFFTFIQESNYSHYHWANPYDAPNTPEPSYPKCFLYSILHSLSPKNVAPNIASLISEILFAIAEMSSLLIALPSYLYSTMEDILHGYVHDPYSPLLLRCEHSHYYILESPNPECVPGCHLAIQDIDILSPKLCGLSNYSHYDYPSYILPYSKGNMFIETKVAAMKLQGFNLFLR